MDAIVIAEDRELTPEQEIKARELELLEQKSTRQRELPHLYGWPWYAWAWMFFINIDSKIQMICAANQISKSSTQIRKCIHWATKVSLWEKLWGRDPNIFWYLYPSKEVATVEFKKKWVPEFLPRGEMKEHRIYGWRAIYEGKFISAVEFNSGVTVYFKTYAQDVSRLQTGSVYAIFCDEELPEELYSELKARLFGTQGYFHMVFTATIGQEIWWRAMEAIGTHQEFLPHAHKQIISMYDCLEYLDGSPSTWTHERIRDVEADCKSKEEILRRVYGRFVKTEGRLVPHFDPTRHYCKPFEVPYSWPKYVGVDIGSGGEKGHPSAIVFIVVNPEYTKAWIYKGWRGDKISTTNGDVYNKYLELLDKRDNTVQKSYDYSAADFGTITARMGDSFTKADKNHIKGYGIINTLLKHKMLYIFSDDHELVKLGSEWLTILEGIPKNKAKDDFSDAARYGLVSIPFDFSKVEDTELTKIDSPRARIPRTKQEQLDYEIDQRRAMFIGDDERETPQDWGELELDIEEYNEQYGNR